MQYQRKAYAMEQRKALVPEELLVAVPADAQLQWSDDHEFEWHGKRYDVIRKGFNRNGIPVFWCFEDTEEQKVLGFLDDLVNREADEDCTDDTEDVLKLTYLQSKNSSAMRCNNLLPLTDPENRLYSILNGYSNVPDQPPRISFCI